MSQSKNIFALLDQNGPFRVDDEPEDGRLFSPRSRQRLQELKKSGLVSKYRVTRNQIFELLGVRSFAGIQDLLGQSEQRRIVEIRAYMLLGNMFGMDGNAREVVARINS
ncbi:MAG: hypothetical protein ACNA74_04240, partial [Desulfurivibrio sp.]